jgi:hypothetical protein
LSSLLGLSPPPAPHDGTEKLFISFWDGNLRDIIEDIVPGGVSIRDSNRDTSMCSQRPDYAIYTVRSVYFRERRNHRAIRRILELSSGTKSPGYMIQLLMFWVNYQTSQVYILA